MEFRKMVTITLYVRQQKRHRCIEQSFGLCGREREWDDLGEWHWNMYIIICETDHQSRLDALRQGAQGWCTGMTQRDGTGIEEGGGFRIENTCTPEADSCWCMAKPIQYCKVIQFSSVAQSCPTLCDPMNHSTPGLPVHHQLLEFTQIHVHWVGDAIQPSHPLLFPSPPAPNPSQHQSLFQWVNSSHEVAKVLEFQL